MNRQPSASIKGITRGSEYLVESIPTGFEFRRVGLGVDKAAQALDSLDEVVGSRANVIRVCERPPRRAHPFHFVAYRRVGARSMSRARMPRRPTHSDKGFLNARSKQSVGGAFTLAFTAAIPVVKAGLHERISRRREATGPRSRPKASRAPHSSASPCWSAPKSEPYPLHG